MAGKAFRRNCGDGVFGCVSAIRICATDKQGLNTTLQCLSKLTVNQKAEVCGVSVLVVWIENHLHWLNMVGKPITLRG